MRGGCGGVVGAGGGGCVCVCGGGGECVCVCVCGGGGGLFGGSDFKNHPSHIPISLQNRFCELPT